MAYNFKRVQSFDKGIIDELGDEVIPAGASSNSTNFLDLGDRIELVRGQLLFGDANATTGEVNGLMSVKAIDGTEHMYKKVGTVLQHKEVATDTWNDVITGLPDGEEMSWDTYRTPAGAFLWLSSPNSGLYRINAANPETFVDLYDASKNFRGNITIQDNRMWLWGDVAATTITGAVVGNDAVIRISHIDADYPYTSVASEALDTGDGSATYSGTLANTLIVARTFIVTHSSETFTDVASTGVLTGSAGGTGTINYTTGAWSVTFDSAPGSGAITGDYSYEDPVTNGIADFRYTTPTRVAGEGAFFFQGKNSDPVVTVASHDGIFYCFHERSIWTIDLKDDDTDATNKIYRENTGVASLNGARATGDGIFYIDTASGEKPKFRLLRYNLRSSKVIPRDVSERLNLEDYDFTNAYAYEYGDFVIFMARLGDDSYNSVMWLYNTKWKLWDKVDALFNNLVQHNGLLYGGSSVDRDVFQMFSGFDDNEDAIAGNWESNDWILDEEERKKCKKFVVEGDMATGQTLIVEVSYDGGDFRSVGTIAGTSKYVDASASTEYGVALYGGSEYGGGATVETFRYMRKFRFDSTKFYRIKVRFRTTSIGYLNVRMYKFDDIRKAGHKLPDKFR